MYLEILGDTAANGKTYSVQNQEVVLILH